MKKIITVLLIISTSTTLSAQHPLDSMVRVADAFFEAESKRISTKPYSDTAIRSVPNAHKSRTDTPRQMLRMYDTASPHYALTLVHGDTLDVSVAMSAASRYETVHVCNYHHTASYYEKIRKAPLEKWTVIKQRGEIVKIEVDAFIADKRMYPGFVLYQKPW